VLQRLNRFSAKSNNIYSSFVMLARHLKACPWSCAVRAQEHRSGKSRAAESGTFPFLLLQVLCNSKNGIVRDCFLLSELDNRRRPETVSCVWSLNFEYELNFQVLIKPLIILSLVLNSGECFAGVTPLLASWWSNSDVAEAAASKVTYLDVIINASF